MLVEGTSVGYYQTLMDYIHLNAVRARLIQPKRGQSVLDYPWSSVAGGYALPPRRRAKWLAVPGGLKEFGLEDTTASRRRMVERLAAAPWWRRRADAGFLNYRRRWMRGAAT